MSVQFISTPATEQVEWREVPGHLGYRASSLGDIQTRWIKGKSIGRSPKKETYRIRSNIEKYLRVLY